jgi:hypothetical protein
MKTTEFVTNNNMVIVPHSPYSPDLDFHGAVEAWKKQWDRCIRSQGDYFEGDGSQN